MTSNATTPIISVDSIDPRRTECVDAGTIGLADIEDRTKQIYRGMGGTGRVARGGIRGTTLGGSPNYTRCARFCQLIPPPAERLKRGIYRTFDDGLSVAKRGGGTDPITACC